MEEPIGMASPNKRSQHDEESVGMASPNKRSQHDEGSVGMAFPNKRSRRDEESLGRQDNSEGNRDNSKSGSSQETSITIFAMPVSSPDGENHVTDIDVLAQNPEKDIGPVSSPKVPFRTVQQSSVYHGVTRNKVTGRFEAGLWDKTHQKEGQSRKGRQVYLGGYDSEEKAARAYDLAALKYWGLNATRLNFPISNYEKELEEMQDMSREEFVSSIKRQSSCFSKGTSPYRGVTRHKKEGSKWQARIGRLTGTRELHLGSFDTEEEAAIAYDIAAVELRGLKAVTNFNISNYIKGDRQITEEFTKLREIAQASKKRS